MLDKTLHVDVLYPDSTKALADIVYLLSTKNNNVMIEGHLGSLFIFHLQYVYSSYWFPIHGSIS